MFYGVVVKPGQTVALEPEAEVLHLSQACLSEPKDASKTYLTLENDKGTFNLCALQKDKCEHAALDLFLAGESGVKFSVKGTNEVHLVGYWEPSAGSDDDMGDMDGLGEGLEDSDEETSVSFPDQAGAPRGLEDDIDGEFDDEDDDEDDEDDDEDEVENVQEKKPKAQPFGASGNKQKPKVAEAKPAAAKVPAVVANQQPATKAQPKNKAAEPKKQAAEPKKQAGKAAPKEADQSLKRKPEAVAATPPTGDKKAKQDGAEGKFHDDLLDYLTKNGRTSFSELGSKVKKPDGVSKKLAAFVKEKPTVFKVDGSHVELVK